MNVLVCAVWVFWLVERQSVLSRGVLVALTTFSFINIFRVFLIKNGKVSILRSTTLSLIKILKKYFYPIKPNWYDVLLTKTKVFYLLFTLN